MTQPSFAIMGCGRLGTALGKHLVKAGYPLAGLTGKSESSIEESARIIATDPVRGLPPWEITRKADVVFITTPDGIISEACKTLTDHNGFKKNAVVLHCSGAHPSTILSSARQGAGALIGSMHPLQSFASKDLPGNPFMGIIVSVEGSDEAVKIASAMAAGLGARVLPIRTEAKTMYHASAVAASNYLVTLFDLAIRLMKTAGVSSEEAFGVLKPLVEGTLSNIENVGIPQALTGPIARGDTQTVEGHIEAMKSLTPELIPLYTILGSYTIDIARAKGGVSEEALDKLIRILRAPPATLTD
jgi:predicted short-subunit dehydrogenase-like oxidoreductase (DUF2520 family)